MRAPPRGVRALFPSLRKGWEGTPLVLLALFAGSAWRLQESCIAATVRSGVGTGAESCLSEADATGASLEVKVEVVVAKEVVEEPGFATMVGSGSSGVEGTHLELALVVVVVARVVMEEGFVGLLCRRKRQN